MKVWTQLFGRKKEQPPARATSVVPIRRVPSGGPRRPTDVYATSALAQLGGFVRSDVRSAHAFRMVSEMRTFNPDVSMAVANIVQLANPGYDIRVYKWKPRADKPELDTVGMGMIAEFATRLFGEYSGAAAAIPSGQRESFPGLDVMISMILESCATFGAAAIELGLTEDLRDIADAYPVDVSLIDFTMDVDRRLVPYFKVDTKRTPINPFLFRYAAVSPEPNNPGGRSPLLAALDTVFFQQEFYRDLQQFVHMANVPRLDVKLIEEMAIKALTAGRQDLLVPGKEKERQDYLDAFLDDAATMINDLKPDDAFIHWDTVEAKYTAPGGVAVPVRDIQAAISTQMVAGTQMLPILLGRTESATTTHATVQWQVFVQRLEAYQRVARALVVWVLETYLRLHGQQAWVWFGFKKHRTSDRLNDARAKQTETQTWLTQVNAGWASRDEAAEDLLGHNAVGDPITPTVPTDSTTDTGQPRAAELDAEDWLEACMTRTVQELTLWQERAIFPRVASAGVSIIPQADAHGVRRFLLDRLQLQPTATYELGGLLTTELRLVAESAIAKHVAALHLSGDRLTDPSVLGALAMVGERMAKCFIEQFNADIAHSVREAVRDGQGFTPLASQKVIKQVLTGIRANQRVRLQRMAEQEALNVAATGVQLGTAAFFQRNCVIGLADVVMLYPAMAGEYAALIADNPYPSAGEALRAMGEAPAYVRLHKGCEVKGMVWCG